MKSNEEFIAGIYRKAELASRMEIEQKEKRSPFSLRSGAILLAAAAACLVLVVQAGRGKNLNIDTTQAPTEEYGISVAQEENGLVALADTEASNANMMSRVAEPEAEYQVSVKLTMVEGAGGSEVTMHYEVLEVLEMQDGAKELQTGDEIVLTLTEADMAWYYPEGALAGSTQTLQLYTEESELRLLGVE